MKRSHPMRYLSRRSFLASAAAAGLAGCGPAGQNKRITRSGTKDAAIVRARKKAARRRRRLIYDDPSDMVYRWEPETGIDEFYRLRLANLLDTPIDSVYWSVMWGLANKRRPIRYWETALRGKAFHPKMPDPSPLVAEYCRKHGLESFAEVRMNDPHDSHGIPFPELKYPLKVEHPEFLIGDKSQKEHRTPGKKGPHNKTFAATTWGRFDYAHPEVREDRFWWLNHVASRYRFDGVDMNFCRAPRFFKTGEETKNMHLMTDLIRRARRRMDELSWRRGSPILLSAHIPDTVDACLRVGLDIETWLKENLIDVLIGGTGYAAFSAPHEELIDLGHRYEVPVYPCINCPIGVMGDHFEAFRGAASNIWHAGADGIYLFNYMFRMFRKGGHPYGEPPLSEYKNLSEIGDPKTLARHDKIFAVNRAQNTLFYAHAIATCPLPVGLENRAGGIPKKVPVRIGDDVAAADQAGALHDVKLHLDLTGEVPGDQLCIRMNGHLLGDAASHKEKWTVYSLPPQCLKQGVNTLEIAVMDRGEMAKEELVLEQAWVWVRYLT